SVLGRSAGFSAGEGVPRLLQAVRLEQVRPAVLVIAPFAILTLISATVLVLVLQPQDYATSNPTLLAGGLAYAMAVVLLVRHGLLGIGKLQDLGLTDSLAAMPNRRALHLDYARAPSGHERALALLDLDGFKSINDQYGHFVGDRLIKECGKLLADVCGADGRSYRLGGDELAIL